VERTDIMPRHTGWGDIVARWGGIAALVVLAGACASTPETSGESGADEATSEARTASAPDETSSASEGTEVDSPETETSTGEEVDQKQEPTLSTRERLEGAIEQVRRADASGARQTLEQLVEHPEQGYLAAYNLGALAEQGGDLREAARRYNQALEKEPEFTPALSNLVRLYIREGRIDDADRVAKKFIEQSPDNLDHKAVRLEVLLAREQYSDVVRRARSVLQRDQKNVEAMLAMATANYELDRFELARAILQRASDLDGDRADLYFLFGLIAMENDNRSRAIANFQKAIDLRPRFAEAHNNLGLLYHEAGDYKSAGQKFQAALDGYPNFKEARLNLGNAYKRLGQPEKALEQYDKLVEMDGDYADAYYNLGLLYLDTKVSGMDKIPRLKKAIEMLNEYKRASRGQIDSNDPADKYISSARDKIKAEKQRRKMMRQAQQGGGGASSSSSGSSSTSGQNSGNTNQNGTSPNGDSGNASGNESNAPTNSDETSSEP
jgi:tetratricopeptide (TPR) repeat protein